ncbi:MAG: hypothetical protein M0Z94_01920 [Dehalococcoidales bacterium]|nr:hypothetical protein [Dehalococcoidales bacterium]
MRAGTDYDAIIVGGGHNLSLDRMLFFRPLPELSGYRTPIKGPYLTGARTHPIGGVTGMAGRNAARVVLADWERPRRLWQSGAALAVGGAALALAGVAGRRAR